MTSVRVRLATRNFECFVGELFKDVERAGGGGRIPRAWRRHIRGMYDDSHCSCVALDATTHTKAGPIIVMAAASEEIRISTTTLRCRIVKSPK